MNCTVILSIGAPGARCCAAAIALAIDSDHAVDGDDVETGLVRSRVASRKASSAPKNSVVATRKPVVAANNKNSAAGKPIQRCHRRHHAVFIADYSSAAAATTRLRPKCFARYSR